MSRELEFLVHLKRAMKEIAAQDGFIIDSMNVQEEYYSRGGIFVSFRLARGTPVVKTTNQEAEAKQ